MPRTLGLFVAVLIMALLGALVLNFDDSDDTAGMLLFLWSDGTNDEQIGSASALKLTEGSGVEITRPMTGDDEVEYVFAFDSSSLPSTTVTFQSTSDSEVVEGAVTINEGTGIDVVLTDVGNVATYALEADQDELDRTTVAGGSGITVTAGAADATTGVRQYTVADDGDDISFFLDGVDTGEDREGIDLHAGTNVTISQTAHSDRLSYTINSTASGTTNVTFDTEGGSSVSGDDVSIDGGDGIDVTLTDSSGVATYTIDSDIEYLVGTDAYTDKYEVQFAEGDGIELTGSEPTTARVRMEIAVDEDTLDRTTVIAGNAIDVTASAADAATGTRDYTVAVDETAIDRTTITGGDGITVTAGTQNAAGARGVHNRVRHRVSGRFRPVRRPA